MDFTTIPQALSCKTCGCKPKLPQPGCKCGCHKPYRPAKTYPVINALAVAEIVGHHLELACLRSQSPDFFIALPGELVEVELGLIFSELHKTYHGGDIGSCGPGCPFARIMARIDRIAEVS